MTKSYRLFFTLCCAVSVHAQTVTATVNVGSFPVSVAGNPVTNKIYVANALSANVTVIDGATNSTTTVSVGTSPDSVAVNPVTNKIYVANGESSSVTVIDSATHPPDLPPLSG
jgi:YVTN family beta-propeller protein